MENTHDLLDSMIVDLPAGRSGTVEVRTFIVSPEDEAMQRLRCAVNGSTRYCPTGTYTALYRNGMLWMSDTPDERTDSLICLCHAARIGAESALVNGLGLGSVLRGLMAIGVRRLDVVEIDPDVIALVGPTYQRLCADAGVELHIYPGDAYTIELDGAWDIVWSDIWVDVCSTNLAEMDRLVRKYDARCCWHGQWGRELIYEMRRGFRETSYACGSCARFGHDAECSYDFEL